MKAVTINRVLTKLYADVSEPSSFSSINRLYKHAKDKYPLITREEVRNWLIRQRVHQLYKRPSKQIRARTYASNPFERLQADLADVPQLAKENNKTKYWLVVIDIFSKMFFVEPLTNKMSSLVAAAMDRILAAIPDDSRVLSLTTDAGTEFMGHPFQQVINEHNIKHYVMLGEKKASIAERAIKTLKVKMSKYMHYANSRRYIERLPAVVVGLNRRVNRVTGYSPEDIIRNKAIRLNIIKKMYPPRAGIYRFKYEIGQTVRILLSKTKFTRATDPSYSEEVFLVYDRIPKIPPRYIIRGLDGITITGTWYDFELQPI